jgi:hypothetical protein
VSHAATTHDSYPPLAFSLEGSESYSRILLGDRKDGYSLRRVSSPALAAMGAVSLWRLVRTTATSLRSIVAPQLTLKPWALKPHIPENVCLRVCAAGCAPPPPLSQGQCAFPASSFYDAGESE